MKKFILFFLSLLFIQFTFAQSVLQSPGTAETSPSSACMACPGEVWQNENSALADDGQYATVTLQQNGFCFQSTCFASRSLFTYNYGFAVPAAATIVGIEVQIKAMPQAAVACKDTVVQLVASGTPIGSNVANTITWPAGVSTRTYGGPAALWGNAPGFLTPAIVNNSQFGLFFQVSNNLATQEIFSVDHVTIRVYYTIAGGCNLQFTVDNTNPLCFNDSTAIATVHASGGQAPYSFLWMPFGGTDSTSNNLPGGNFQVQVTDNLGCVDTAIVEIINPEPVTTLLMVQICPEDSVFLAGAWQNQGGTYTDSSISILGCDSLVYTTLSIYASPTVTLNLEPDTTVCFNDPDTLSGGLPLGGIFSGPFVSGGLFDNDNANGGYNLITYTFTSVEGCSAQALDSIFVEICGDVKSPWTDFKLDIFPNPVSDKLTIHSPDAILEKISLIDISGKILFEIEPGNFNSVLDVSLLPESIYLLRIQTSHGLKIEKLAIQ